MPAQKKKSAQFRAQFLRAIDKHASVTELCKQFKISRKTFYKWKNIFEKENHTENRKQGRKETIDPRVLEMVKQLIVANPEWSVDKLYKELCSANNGEQLVSRKWIQYRLQKNNLSTMQSRKVYSYTIAPPQTITRPIAIADSVEAPVTQQQVLHAGNSSPPRYAVFKHSFYSKVNQIYSILHPYVAPHIQPQHRKSIKDTAVFIWSNPYKSLLTTGIALANAYLFGLVGNAIIQADGIGAKIGTMFSALALFCGTFFFLYSLKYYFTVAMVIVRSRTSTQRGALNEEEQSLKSKVLTALKSAGLYLSNQLEVPHTNPVELQKEVVKEQLEKFPFFSVQIPLYNEKKVANRVVAAAVAMDYPNFEVIVCDDSTDETTKLLEEKWGNHPKVRILHRAQRTGYKGAALHNALSYMNKDTDYVVVFDADFVPYPDTLNLFAKYFAVIGRNERNNSSNKINSFANNLVNSYNNNIKDAILTSKNKASSYYNKTVALQGYQWHVLNKSENWITRAVRTEFSGSYIIERSGTQLFSLLKQIAGSVYAINATVLKEVGWGTSITEDFQLTLKLYEQGYKVAYTPYIQAPSECVSTLKRLIRQRQRWAEGHSHNMKLRLHNLLSSKNMTTKEKWETVYLAPYYLQSFIFIIGTFAWIIAEVVLKVKLPFWTSALGWSLVLTNLFSLPLMNTIGLFLEEGEERDYLGIFSFVTLCYILAPFIGWAALKGYIEKEEGPWFRTPKSGRITDKVERTAEKKPSHIGKYAPWIKPALDIIRKNAPAIEFPAGSKYLAYATAGNTFSNTPWVVRSSKLKKRMVHTIILFLTGLTALTNVLQTTVPQAFANPDTYYARSDYSDNITRSATAERVQGSTTDNWYNASWSFRKKITINESQISGSSDLVKFPVLISITDADLAADAQDDGDDIVFTLGDKTTKLAHEIESFNGTTGALVAWVKIPSLSATANTKIYMYYGNGSATSQQNVASVWEEYIGVWHLKETPDSNAGTTEINDSTGINNGTAEGSMDGTDSVTGKMGNALDFDGVNDRINAGTASVLNLERTNQITMQAWFKTTGNGSGSIMGKMDNNTSDRGYQMQKGGSGKVFGQVVNTYSSNGIEKSSSSDSNYYDGSWHHLVTTYDGSSAASGLNLYFDGSLHTVGTGFDNLNATIINSAPFTIGSRSGTNAQYYSGQIDEVRLSSKVRSADWVNAEYNNQNSPGTFATVGSEEARVTSTGQDPQTMTMDGTNTTFYMLTDNLNKVWSNDIEVNDSNTSGERRNVQIATHTDGSTVAVWEDSRNSSTTYTNRVDPTRGNMAIAKMNNSVSLLLNGRVLYAGGLSGTATFNSAAELYDPTTQTFTATAGNMKIARIDHEAVSLDNSRVLIAGGRTATNTVVSSAEVYDPNDQTAATSFTATTGNMIGLRTNFALTKLTNGKALASGGCSTFAASVCSARVSTAEIYDPATNTWTLTGSFVSGLRQNHTAIRLSDGRVLAVGGFNGTARLSTAEIYDPAGGTWLRAASMSQVKEQVGLSTLPDNRILAVGGFDGTNYLSTAEIYDPVGNTWTSTGALSANLAGGYRNNQVVRLGNNKVLAVNADNTANGSSTAQLYEPLTGTWTATGTNLTIARESAIPVLLNNGSVIIGGGSSGGTALSSAQLYVPETFDIYTQKYDSSGAKLWNSGADIKVNSDDGARYSASGPSLYNHLYPNVSLDSSGNPIIAWEEQRDGVFNSTVWSQKLSAAAGAKQWPVGTQGAWTAGANMPRIHSSAAFGVLQNGKIIVAGGNNGNSVSLTATDIYDPVANTWSTAGNMPTLLGTYTQGATLMNGSFIAPGGSDGQTTLLYNQQSGTWTATGSLLAYRAELGDVIPLNNGKALVAGGTDYANANSSAELYDPVTGTWTLTTGGMKVPKYRGRYVKLPSGNVLAVGGCSTYTTCSSNISTAAEIYNPITNAWTDAGGLNIGRMEMSTNLLLSGKVLAVGGKVSGGNATSSAEIYDPATNTWSVVATAPGVITDDITKASAVLQNGKVLVYGGYNGSYAYLYDPAANTWSTTSSLLSIKGNAAIGQLTNGKIFVAGGQNSSFNGGFSALELYNLPGADKKVSTDNSYIPEYGTSVFNKKPKVAIDSSDNAVIVWQENEYTKPAANTPAFNYDANTYRRIGLVGPGLGQTQIGSNGGAASNILSQAAQIRGQKICGNASGCDAGTTSGERQWGDTQNNINKNNPQDIPLSTNRSSQNVSIVNDGTNMVMAYEADNAENGMASKTSKIFTQKIDSSGNAVWSDGFLVSTSGSVIARRTHTATLLGDGRVLLAGGQNSVILSSGEVYNPITNTSVLATNNMPVRRINHTATLLENGRVLQVGGGTSATTGQSTSDLFTMSATSGSFAAGPNLRLGTRAEHTATMLRTGQVLIAGGRNAAATTQMSTSEIYNPVGNTFTATTGFNRSAPRSNHEATIMADGRVLIAGGTNGTGPLSSAEIYDPNGSTWTLTTPMNTKRRMFTLSLLGNGKILAVGGCIVGGGATCTAGAANVTSTAELYDPMTSTWTSTAGNLTISGRSEHSALVLPNGKVLIAGGTSDGTADLSSSEIYDPVTGTFTAGRVSTIGRKNHEMVGLANGDLLLAGGWDDTTVYTSVERYRTDQKVSVADGTNSRNPDLIKGSDGNFDIVWQAWRTEGLSPGTSGGSWKIVQQSINNPASNSITRTLPTGTTGAWAATGSLSQARKAAGIALMQNGKVLMAGGTDSGRTTAYSIAEIYDPQTGTWTQTASMANARYGNAMFLLPSGRVITMGGYNATALATLSSSEIYDPVSGTWSAGPNMRVARREFQTAVLNDGKILLAGGANGGEALGTVLSSSELYDPVTNTFTLTTGNMPSIRKIGKAVKLASGQVLAVGGCSTENFCGTALSSSAIYNPTSQTWAAAANMPGAMFQPSVTALPNGRVLAVADTTAYLYDPGTATWTATTGPTFNVQGGYFTQQRMAMLPNGKVLAPRSDNGANTYLYDPFANTWSATGSMSQSNTDMSGILLKNGKYLIAGGQVFGGNLASSAELYTPDLSEKLVGSDDTAQSFNQTDPKIASDSASGISYTAWSDTRPINPSDTTYDRNIFMQKTDSSGNPAWPNGLGENGSYNVHDIIVNNTRGTIATGEQQGVSIGKRTFVDGAKTPVQLAWSDTRDGTPPVSIYAQSYDTLNRSMTSTSWTAYFIVNSWDTTDALQVQVGAMEANGEIRSFESTVGSLTAAGSPGDGEKSVVFSNMPPSGETSLTHRRLIMKITRTAGTYTLRYNGPNDVSASIDADTRLDVGIVVPERSALLGLIIPFIPLMVFGYKRRQYRRYKSEIVNKRP